MTTPRGQAFLAVTSDTAQRDDLRLAIEGNPKLVIFEPADGQLHGISATVPVKLLPIGSPALLGPAQIEAALHRALLRVNSLHSQNRVLRQQAADAKSQQQDLREPLAAWAKANGFPADEVNPVTTFVAEVPLSVSNSEQLPRGPSG